MLRELTHFFRHVPGVARLSVKMSHDELFNVLMERAEEAGFDRWRTRLVRDLEGKVLEIGCGTGCMFRHYPEGLEVTATEPAERFLKHARIAAESCKARVTPEVASAEDLPFEDNSFDAVVITGVLCSVDCVQTSLAEIRRVLKSHAEVRLIEHVRSRRAIPGLLMHLFNPLWRLYNRQGCNMNRRTDAALEAAGFSLEEIEPFQIFAPGLPAFPSLLIRATKQTDTLDACPTSPSASAS